MNAVSMDLDLDALALKLGALPDAPLPMPVQPLEAQFVTEIVQSGGLLGYALRLLTAPRGAAGAGN